jgi:hypothetical protein
MPFETFWYAEPRITVGRFHGVVTMDELHEANQVAIERIRAGEPPVHVIVDTLAIERVPVSVRAITDLIAYTREPQLGWIIYIADNRFIRFLSSVVAQVAGANFHNARTMEDGLDALIRLDPTVAPLIAARN